MSICQLEAIIGQALQNRHDGKNWERAREELKQALIFFGNGEEARGIVWLRVSSRTKDILDQTNWLGVFDDNIVKLIERKRPDQRLSPPQTQKAL